MMDTRKTQTRIDWVRQSCRSESVCVVLVPVDIDARVAEEYLVLNR